MHVPAEHVPAEHVPAEHVPAEHVPAEYVPASMCRYPDNRGQMTLNCLESKRCFRHVFTELVNKEISLSWNLVYLPFLSFVIPMLLLLFFYNSPFIAQTNTKQFHIILVVTNKIYIHIHTSIATKILNLYCWKALEMPTFRACAYIIYPVCTLVAMISAFYDYSG